MIIITAIRTLTGYVGFPVFLYSLIIKAHLNLALFFIHVYLCVCVCVSGIRALPTAVKACCFSKDAHLPVGS